MHYNVYQLLMLFLIYSFLGWCVEVSFVAVTTGRVVNRGFLNGPVCPIYGVGMLGALLLLEPVSASVYLSAWNISGAPERFQDGRHHNTKFFLPFSPASFPV